MFATENVVGYEVCCEPLEQVLSRLDALLRKRERACRWFACLNPHSVEVAVRDAHFRSALRDADFLTADGIGIVYASLLGGGRIRSRITGTDIFMGLTRRMEAAGGMRCFFLGSTEETLEKICARMQADFPHVEVAGTHSPPFRPEPSRDDTEEMIERVNASGADVLWVGMTAPKQEKWIHANRHRLDVSFAGPIGAVFDFYAGNVRRAGPAWQRLGLEWLPRLVQEPRRLWRRNLVSTPAFLFRTVRHQLSGERAKGVD